MICFGGLSSSFHFEKSRTVGVAWLGPGATSKAARTYKSMQLHVLVWAICGGSVDFSSQGGLRKATQSENIVVEHGVCGESRPAEL